MAGDQRGQLYRKLSSFTAGPFGTKCHEVKMCCAVPAMISLVFSLMQDEPAPFKQNIRGCSVRQANVGHLITFFAHCAYHGLFGVFPQAQ